MKNLLAVVLLSMMGCASHTTDALEQEAQTLHAPDMEAAIQAAAPGEPRCDASCRSARARAARPG